MWPIRAGTSPMDRILETTTPVPAAKGTVMPGEGQAWSRFSFDSNVTSPPLL